MRLCYVIDAVKCAYPIAQYYNAAKLDLPAHSNSCALNKPAWPNWPKQLRKPEWREANTDLVCAALAYVTTRGARSSHTGETDCLRKEYYDTVKRPVSAATSVAVEPWLGSPNWLILALLCMSPASLVLERGLSLLLRQLPQHKRKSLEPSVSEWHCSPAK